jgi:hypothetical protein
MLPGFAGLWRLPGERGEAAHPFEPVGFLVLVPGLLLPSDDILFPLDQVPQLLRLIDKAKVLVLRQVLFALLLTNNAERQEQLLPGRFAVNAVWQY